MSSKIFHRIHETWVKPAEGGYSNNKADRGGETAWGITKATARAHGYHGSMKKLPYATALEIYEKSYWTPVHGDTLAVLIGSRPTAFLYDWAVNSGPRTAIKAFQEALMWLEPSPGIAVDGIIGTATITKVRKLVNRRSLLGEMVMVYMIMRRMLGRVKHVKNDPTQRTFAVGWTYRIGMFLQDRDYDTHVQPKPEPATKDDVHTAVSKAVCKASPLSKQDVMDAMMEVVSRVALTTRARK